VASYSSFGVLRDAAVRNSKNVPAWVNATFGTLYAVFLIIWVVLLVDEYHHRVYLLNKAIRVPGIVTHKDFVQYSRRTEYYIDYSFRPGGLRSNGSLIVSPEHPVSRDNYDRYSVGGTIPTMYNPKDVTDTHLDVQDQSAEKWAVTFIVEGLLYGAVYGVLFFMPLWLLAGWCYRKVTGKSLPPEPKFVHHQPLDIGVDDTTTPRTLYHPLILGADDN
jgi:hypothetical protein